MFLRNAVFVLGSRDWWNNVNIRVLSCLIFGLGLLDFII